MDVNKEIDWSLTYHVDLGVKIEFLGRTFRSLVESVP